MSRRQAKSIGLAIIGAGAAGLGAAHALGVVHRDVKPANVLFDEAGNSYLADFGISVLTDEEEAYVLASLDPITGMATTDDAKLAELLAEAGLNGRIAARRSITILQRVRCRSSKGWGIFQHRLDRFRRHLDLNPGAFLLQHQK